MDDPVRFDMDADGKLERMGWTSGGAALAFLVSDLNGNGIIDDGRELFGEGTMLPNGTRATNGFEALRQYDLNRDRVIDSSDSIWDALLLWTDLNHDARSQSNELRLVNESLITGLDLEYRETRRRDIHGNLFRYRARCRVGNARTPFYDIFFVSAQ